MDAVAIDGHVHLRDVREDAQALRAAAQNFARWSPLSSRIGVLMLAEAAGESGFARLRDGIGPSAELKRHATREPESLWIDAFDWRLLVIAGRQLVTREGIEVLALGAPRAFADGQPLRDLLGMLEEAGVVVVLPWGCGKWLGTRRTQVGRALREITTPLLIGDNGNRPRLWRESLLASGRPLLRGSDPLPLPGEFRQIGRFGSILEVQLSEQCPAADVRRALRGSPLLRPFGPHESPGRFVFGQARLQLARSRPVASS